MPSGPRDALAAVARRLVEYALRALVVLGLLIVVVAGPAVAVAALTVAGWLLPAYGGAFEVGKLLALMALPLWVFYLNGRLNDGSTGRRADEDANTSQYLNWDH